MDYFLPLSAIYVLNFIVGLKTESLAKTVLLTMGQMFVLLVSLYFWIYTGLGGNKQVGKLILFIPFLVALLQTITYRIYIYKIFLGSGDN